MKSKKTYRNLSIFNTVITQYTDRWNYDYGAVIDLESATLMKGDKIFQNELIFIIEDE